MVSIGELVASVLIGCLVAGSALLWRRTKRVAALLQLIGSSLLLVSESGTVVVDFSLRHGPSRVSNFMFSHWISTGALIVVVIAVTLFSIGYLWYAVREKRI